MLSQYLPTIPHRRRVSESLHDNDALQRPISRHKLPIRQSKQDMIFQIQFNTGKSDVSHAPNSV